MSSESQHNAVHWFAMRDLKRINAKNPAYKILQDKGLEVFIPMKWRIVTKLGKRIRMELPVMQDLLFVHTNRITLDPIVEKIKTLQYRFLRNTWREPMTVKDVDMMNFINAVKKSNFVQYYMPSEITSEMHNKRIRIVGGNLDGYEGYLLIVRGSKKKRLLVEIPGLLSAAIEVEPDFIQFIL